MNQRKQVWRVAESSSHCRVVTEACCHESSMTFTRRQALHSLHESSVLAKSSPNVAVTSRQPLPSRQASWLFKELRFSALSSFRISVITSSKDVQMKWLKLIWKDNSETYNFNEGIFQKKSRLDGKKCPLSYRLCTELWPLVLSGALPSSIIFKVLPRGISVSKKQINSNQNTTISERLENKQV